MGMPAARLGDMHVCPLVTVLVPHVGGPIALTTANTTLIGGLPAATVTSMATCVGPPDLVMPPGAFNVLISGLPAARVLDMTAHGGFIALGCFNVLIGTASGSSGGGGGAGASASCGAPPDT